MRFTVKNVDLDRHANTVIKRIVLSPLGHPRDVSGFDYWYGEGTKQQAYPGDLLITTKWEQGNFVSTGYRVCDGKNITMVRANDFNVVNEQLKRVNGLFLSEDVRQWLYTPINNSEKSRKLPAGCGWDGKRTNSQHSRYFRTRRLFEACLDPEWVEKISVAAAFTPAAAVAFSPTFRELPRYFTVVDERKGARHGAINRENPNPVIYYYCICRDGSAKVVVPTVGKDILIPEEYCTVIKIYYNAYIGYNGAFGVQWTYYSRLAATNLRDDVEAA